MKKYQDPFYIGYLPSMPDGIKRIIKSVVIIGTLLSILSAAFLGVSLQTSEASKYELGQLTELEGVILQEPFPVLRVKAGEDFQGKPMFQTLLLIDFGKFGAEKTLSELETMAAEKGGSLSEMKVSVSGTLDYREGRALFELTKGTKALKGMEPLPQNEKAVWTLRRKALGSHTFTGEIVDGKCYFGTMKPGKGKPHRSCAVRCIAGGLPAFLAGAGAEVPLLLKGTGVTPINDQLLPMVAQSVSVSGTLVQYEDWWVLETDMEKLKLVDRTQAGWIQDCLTYNP